MQERRAEPTSRVVFISPKIGGNRETLGQRLFFWCGSVAWSVGWYQSKFRPFASDRTCDHDRGSRAGSRGRGLSLLPKLKQMESELQCLQKRVAVRANAFRQRCWASPLGSAAKEPRYRPPFLQHCLSEAAPFARWGWLGIFSITRSDPRANFFGREEVVCWRGERSRS